MFSVLPPTNTLVLAALCLVLTRLSCSSVSVPDIPHIAAYFGTKTRYEEVNPHLLRDVFSVNSSILKPPPSERCTPVHLTAIIRHGSRYPTVKNIRRIHKLSELVRREAPPGGASSAGWLQDIQNRWENWSAGDEGERRSSSAGRPSLLVVPVAPLRGEHEEDQFEEQLEASLCEQRGGVSRRPAAGVEPPGRAVQPPGGRRAHALLRALPWLCGGRGEQPHSTAGGGEVQTRHGDGGSEEEDGREAGPASPPASPQKCPHAEDCPSMSPVDLVEAAFFLCSYELSINLFILPWCFLFDENDAKVLEYKSDLKQFWKRSHGHVISSLSSCPLFHHVFRTLDKAGRPRRSTEASPEPASILVGHAETLLPLLSLLGLYKDQTSPTADNYHSQHGRSFRTSLIVPYAANLLFVLYDCQRGPRLQMLINESPVQFPGLMEDAPLYRDVRATYRHLLDGCDFHRECEGRPGGRGPNTEL
ncbi:Multiple inositol polyphosphate phosphatase 1 [Collichthys lucidus]|uniref:Multiple inositol polyphosphate phosphatase 1 n=1 Tax=Collichthys lucidus TaxID=240159 RepID=A0A4U5VPA5_COLLU|nr:Multiple inositol polyphosphate phosphatase 1 [Collichthys lucidus]